MTHALGVGLGQVLHEGDLVCLQGELGSGKTHLTKGIAAGLGVTERVTSPTFIIVNEYSLAERRFKLYHIDLYRVESLAEARATGLDEYWSGSDICVIEWAERVRALLPADRLWVHLEHCSPSSRRMAFEACGPRSIELLERFQPVMARMLATRGVGSEASRCS
ncbi:MAG TPA: tRNA (adenosine(37)-N6)-threonylcarbamoyltransferase complex ATPase subunit type 1 TsaE [Anaerolineae bacterium]|nr:tRNA (adenosine(37)-N6)-threonylcarbamoyltransferase complex ATPase subunit type 1 TsaE [Anaerolineae bacterium]